MNRTYSRTHANRGSKLEMLVEMTHNQYRNAKVADIRKVPVPTKILKNHGRNFTGVFESGNWVDYSGIYQGKSIIFDAKETKEKRFPLKNVSAHQYELLQSWDYYGAVSFLLICFWLEGKNEPEVYILRFDQLQEAWEKQSAGGAKSIPLAFFQESCTRVKSGNGFVLNYLAALTVEDEEIILKGALEKILELEGPNLEGWETGIHKIAREALGISEKEYFG